MSIHDGKTYTVGYQGTSDIYTFANEEWAKEFQRSRTVHQMTYGNKPTDDGNFFMTPEEKDEVLKKEPKLEKFIRRCYGSREFIQGIERYCFWLVDATPADIKRSKILYERVGKVKEFRLASTDKSTRKKAETPHLFQETRQPTTEYLLIPRHSSGLRQYVPMGYMPPEVIVTDAAFALPYATPYHFGILTSRVHMGWMRRVCGRLKSDYRYSNTIVYNTFMWPKSNPWQVKKIAECANKILEVRARHEGCTFADLYDELTMPKDLREAHRENDAAVCEAYGLAADTDEEDVIMHMFRLYYAAIGEEIPE